MHSKICKNSPRKTTKNKALHDNEILKQAVPIKMISSDLEEKNAGSYAESWINNKTEDSSVSQEYDLNQLKSRNESDDIQHIAQIADMLMNQNDKKNLFMMPNLNQAMGGVVADIIMNQNTNEKQSQVSCSSAYSYSSYSEESAKKSVLEAVKPQYLPSLKFDNTSTERQPSENNYTNQQTSSNPNGFFQQGKTEQKQKPQSLMDSSDSYISDPIVASRRRNAEKPPNASVGMTSYTPVDLNTQLPSDQPTEQQEENHRPGKGCCSIM